MHPRETVTPVTFLYESAMKYLLGIIIFSLTIVSCNNNSVADRQSADGTQSVQAVANTFVPTNMDEFTEALDRILSLKMAPEERTDSALTFIRIYAHHFTAYEFSESLITDRMIPEAIEKNMSDLLLARLYDEAGQMQGRQGASRRNDWTANYDKALDHARKSGNRYWLGRILAHKALCELSFGDTAQSYQLNEEAIKAYKGSGHDSDKRIARSYYGEAVVMLQAGDMDGMKKVIDHLKEHADTIPDTYRDFVRYNVYTIQNVYFSNLLDNSTGENRKELLDSMDRVSIASILLIENMDLSDIDINPVWDYYNRAVSFVNYHDKPRVDSIEYYLKRMSEITHEGKRTDIMEAEVSAAQLRADMWIKLGNYQRAKQSIEAALAKADTLQGVNNILIDKIELYKYLVTMAKQTDNYKEATDYAETVTALEKERYSDVRARAIKEFEIKYKTQETELALAQSEARQANTMMWLLVVVVALTLAVSGFVIYALRSRRNKMQREMEFANERADVTRQLTRQYIEGLETERKRMSRELHDGVCNDLLAIQMNMRNDSDAESTERLIESCRESVRRISHELMPPEFAYATIDEVARYYADKQKHSGKTVTYHSQISDNTWDAVPNNIAIEVYRIIQEAVGNAIKHSGGDIINISMKLHSDTLTVSITDNGHHGGTVRQGIGINSMKRRANAIDGKLDISTTDSDGTKVILTVKL